MMTFKSYLPLNKIVSQALRSGNFYDIGQGAYALAHVIQVCSVLLKWQYCSSACMHCLFGQAQRI
jgi:hypothetical protein